MEKTIQKTVTTMPSVTIGKDGVFALNGEAVRMLNERCNGFFSMKILRLMDDVCCLIPTKSDGDIEARIFKGAWYFRSGDTQKRIFKAVGCKAPGLTMFLKPVKVGYYGVVFMMRVQPSNGQKA